MSDWEIFIPKPDPNDIKSVLNSSRDEANMFKSAAERCDMQVRMRGNKVQWQPVAAGVLFALTAELYLKFLLTAENKQYPFIHDLNKLFLLLEDDKKQIIIEKTKYGKDEFYNLLDKNKEMFENWRYLSEEYKDKKGNVKPRSTNLGFIDKFANSLGSVVNGYRI